MREIAAVDSAMPSITPTASALAPSTLTRNTGSRLWIASDETSMNRLTKPSANTPRGSDLRTETRTETGVAAESGMARR